MTNLARQICNNFWQQTLLIVFAGLSSFAFAKEPLSAIVDIKGVKLEQQLLAHYQKVLTKALQQDVRVAQKSILSARAFDILITDNTSLMPSWYQPVYVLDTLPAFNRITLAEQSGEVKLSAAVKRPFVLSTIKHTYPAEDAGTAVRLLKSNKVDAIVDYVKNNSFYRSIGQKLDFTVLSEQTNIIVKFKGAELEKVFSQSSVDLANLKHFDNELTAEILPSGNHIDWFLVGKSINKKEILQPYPGELDVSEYLINKLKGLNVKTDSATVTAVFNKMSKYGNVCLFNTFKSKKRQEIALYSEPTKLYLDYRIIVAKDSKLEQLLESKHNGKSVDLLALLTEHPDLLMGYYWFDRASLPKNWVDYFDQHSGQIVQLKERDIDRSYQLLSRGRVDFVIAYESVFGPHLPPSFSIKDFSSFAIKGRASHAFAYMACSKSELCKNVITQINQLLSLPESRQEIINRYKKYLTDNAQAEFGQLF